MADEIRAKVAGIVAPSQVAFNVGSAAGVEVGYQAEIYYVVEVDDPDTKERLGGVRFTKLRLQITHVQDRLCVGQVSEYGQVHVGVELFPRKSRKRVTFDRSAVDEWTVHIQRGDLVAIRPPEVLSEEPPF